MGFLSAWHWLIIGGVALLLFGNRLPEVARSMGRAINEFKKGLKEVEDDSKKDAGPKPPELTPPSDRPTIARDNSRGSASSEVPPAALPGDEKN